ncbi:UNVERIFIED_CONTAM: hypothetical protein GTU68_002903 [Idotea baltica]|nr:hypothetical protein [Idotea baltica]
MNLRQDCTPATPTAWLGRCERCRQPVTRSSWSSTTMPSFLRRTT